MWDAGGGFILITIAFVPLTAVYPVLLPLRHEDAEILFVYREGSDHHTLHSLILFHHWQHSRSSFSLLLSVVLRLSLFYQCCKLKGHHLQCSWIIFNYVLLHYHSSCSWFVFLASVCNVAQQIHSAAANLILHFGQTKWNFGCCLINRISTYWPLHSCSMTTVSAQKQ